jgi:hypothetical protein
VIQAKLEDFISRLDNYRSTGTDKYIARCPAHEDRSPSLTVGLGRDGGIILHCFAGCSAQDVVESVGMSMSDLFPDDGYESRTGGRRLPQADELVIRMGIEDKEQGRAFKASDRQAFAQAVKRESNRLGTNALSHYQQAEKL